MTASRAKALWVALALLLPVAASAQSGPIELSPLALDPVPGQPATTTPAGVIPVEAPIQVEGLRGVNADTAGALTPEQGGFGTAMWLGTERAVIDTLIVQLPVSTASPESRDLMRRLLMTGAAVPDGGEPGRLITQRIQLLSEMGDFVGTNALLQAVPGRTQNMDLMQVEVDTRLLTGDNARACQLAQTYISDQTSIYWQKVFIFCQALQGQNDAAALGMSLLRELGVEDAVFFDLIDALVSSAKTPTIDSLPDATPLHLALARVAKVQLPSDVNESNRPGVLRAIAISPNAAPELRLEAAERAVAAGALPVDALRQLYASIQFSEADLKDPLARASRRSGPMSRALLYRASLMQTVPTAQAEALAKALDLARAGGSYASTARAFLPVLMRVPAQPELAWFAPEAIRAFLVSERSDDARPWYTLLKDAASKDEKAARALEALMPVMRLAGFIDASEWELKRMAGWWTAVKDEDRARDKAALLAAVFEALGAYVPLENWTPLLAGPSRQSILAPHPSYWFRLEGAAMNARVGETVLLSLVILGDGGAARAEPMVLHRVLRSLRNIGLEREARAMALEAVITAGL